MIRQNRSLLVPFDILEVFIYGLPRPVQGKMAEQPLSNGTGQTLCLLIFLNVLLSASAFLRGLSRAASIRQNGVAFELLSSEIFEAHSPWSASACPRGFNQVAIVGQNRFAFELLSHEDLLGTQSLVWLGLSKGTWLSSHGWTKQVFPSCCGIFKIFEVHPPRSGSDLFEGTRPSSHGRTK
ncbi:hypothetical protein NE237_022219 [Protea cynaroides]|uniref:Uncharacterized protein n=1 Tax=Protea cynaroides TaxID=273540 RepID=A0A9Q0HAJ1_9MAGN|nr:hypothetical protein NE237_022219 [Protea cynaroides]